MKENKMKRSADYELLLQINNAVNRIEEKYDKRFDLIDQEIDKLKEFQNKAIGILSIASAFISLLASYIWQKVRGNP